MKRFKSVMVGFAVSMAFASAGAQAAVQATQHQHTPPTAQQPANAKGMEGMKDMHAMMADPAMRQKMMANMTQCRDMMTMMMEHMEHAEHAGTDKNKSDPHKH